MVKAREFEVPPPGVKTVIAAFPPAPMLLAGIWAVSWPLLTNVVVWVLPFHCTTETGAKFEPFTVKVNAELPTMALPGESVVTLGVNAGVGVGVGDGTGVGVGVGVGPGIEEPLLQPHVPAPMARASNTCTA